MTKQLAMSPVQLLHAVKADCSWCGLNPAVTIVHDSPTCTDCMSSRDWRVTAYLQRLGRAALR